MIEAMSRGDFVTTYLLRPILFANIFSPELTNYSTNARAINLQNRSNYRFIYIDFSIVIFFHYD